MQRQRGKWLCAGYSAGHPAVCSGCEWFGDLEAACAALDRAGGAGDVHAVWLTEKRAAALLRETSDPAVRALLRAQTPGELPDATPAGWDLLGFGDGLCLSWAEEPAGRELSERLQLPPEPTTFLPALRVATELAIELEEDVLSAPVLWLPCWRVVFTGVGAGRHRRDRERSS